MSIPPTWLRGFYVQFSEDTAPRVQYFCMLPILFAYWCGLWIFFSSKIKFM